MAQLAQHIDWSDLNTNGGGSSHRIVIIQRLYRASPGGWITVPAIHFALSDKEVVQRWMEDPYWQLFCGEAWFSQHQPPIDLGSLTRWRWRIGTESMVYGCGHNLRMILKKLRLLLVLIPVRLHWTSAFDVATSYRFTDANP